MADNKDSFEGEIRSIGKYKDKCGIERDILAIPVIQKIANFADLKLGDKVIVVKKNQTRRFK